MMYDLKILKDVFNLTNSSVLLLNLFIISVFTIAFKLFLRYFSKRRNLPPGPFPWPIVGNLFSMGMNGHRIFEHLAQKYGPVMSLKLGSQLAVVVSSPESIKEVFTTYDRACASRPVTVVSDIMTAGGHDIAFAPYGPYWRKARKLVNVHLMTHHKIQSRAAKRMEVIDSMSDFFAKEAKLCDGVVNVRQVLSQATMNNIMLMVFGKYYSFALPGEAKTEGDELMDLIREVLLPFGEFNIADYIPWLSLFDPQHLAKRSKIIRKKIDYYFGKLIDERLRERAVKLEKSKPDKSKPHKSKPEESKSEQSKTGGSVEYEKDFLDVLLSAEEEKFTTSDLVSILNDMFIGGTDTSALTTEWALAALIAHPDKMSRLQKEMDEIEITPETNFSQSPYLQAVIKETFRLYPTVPLLVPRKTIEDVKILGYDIPKNTLLFTNVWAINHDPRVWSQPLMFNPERFFDQAVDLRGHDFCLTPFGSGRRICPGMNLGLANVETMLAVLVKRFAWSFLEPGRSFDFTELASLTMGLAEPLRARIKERNFEE